MLIGAKVSRQEGGWDMRNFSKWSLSLVDLHRGPSVYLLGTFIFSDYIHIFCFQADHRFWSEHQTKHKWVINSSAKATMGREKCNPWTTFPGSVHNHLISWLHTSSSKNNQPGEILAGHHDMEAIDILVSNSRLCNSSRTGLGASCIVWLLLTVVVSTN